MTTEIISVIGLFASEFTCPTWEKMKILLIGAILCRGARRITSILRVMNLSGERNFSKYHRALSRAKWNSLVLSQILFGLLVNLLPKSWPILIAVDETLERRRGKKIKAKGAYRDAVLSSESKVIISFGLKWECMTLIVPLPWCKRPWALPFLTVLAPSKKCNEKAKKRHKTSIDWTQQMVKLVTRWIKRPWILLGDGAYACMELAQTCLKQQVTLISRLRLDSQWSDKAIERTTPLLMGLYSLVTLIGLKINERKTICVQEKTSWYNKNGELTFSDIITTVRKSILMEKYFSKSEKKHDLLKIAANDVNTLIYQLAIAA